MRAHAAAAIALLCAVAAGAGPSRAASLACPASNPPDELVLAGGSGQTAQLGKPFVAPFEVQLASSNGCPLTGALAGYQVSFDAPGSGPSGIFAGSGSRQATVGTNGQGVATAPAFVANFTAGSYAVDAHSDFGTVELRLANTADGIAASIAQNGGATQDASVNGRFGAPLQARVTDAAGRPVQGAVVSFSVVAGPTGAGAMFLGGGPATASTDANGVATSPLLQANATPGRFTVVAATDGVTAVATFDLDNHAAAARLSAVGPARQAAVVGSSYERRLGVRLVDAAGAPVEGASVTFALGASGSSGGGGAAAAGATFSDGSSQAVATTNAAGLAASPVMKANAVAGIFTATATTPGGRPVAYLLRNRAGRPASLAAGAADGTSTPLGSRFPIRLAVTVTDTDGNVVPGAVVRFAAPARGARGRFVVGGRALHAVTVRTNADGIAIAPPFVANRVAGGYAVTARAGLARAAFALVNRA